MAGRKELIQLMKSALVVCMDEAIKVRSGIYIVGIGGSGINGETATEKFPQETLALIKRVRPAMFEALRRVAEKLDVSLAMTSHPGCGWAKAQKLNSKVKLVTQKMAETLGVEYAGHLSVSTQPDEEIGACITRLEKDNRHQADKIILTTGGFITQEEKDKLDPNAFIISADWVETAAKERGLTENDALDFLKLQVAIARGIMDEPSLTMFFYDAKRISVSPVLKQQFNQL